MDKQTSFATPIAIIVAGFMVASAIYVSNSKSGFLNSDKTLGTTAQQAPAGANPSAAPDAAAPEAEDPNKTFVVSIDDDPVLGNANAPVTLIEFSDYRCPFCNRFATDSLAQLKKNYVDTGKLKIVLRDFSIHPPQSDDAALAAQCALDQSKYWEYHNLLWVKYAKEDEFTRDNLKKYASEVGLNASSFNACLDSNKHRSEIDKDSQEGRDLGVSGTPTLFIGKSAADGKVTAIKIVGAQPYDTFATAIDGLLPK